ncbi:unnamed protein product [Linum tenue]|uniref:Uncharacterized protein n=1 Tax=Linum tenue TaxID=586396 RepID=A0AAV0Q2T2_9ROSI|nr:unnamed protein product [Linum tenue]
MAFSVPSHRDKISMELARWLPIASRIISCKWNSMIFGCDTIGLRFYELRNHQLSLKRTKRS